MIGGSYPGALAAWVRAKYPHIVDGAVASSAVVEAVEDLYMYDRQIYMAMERDNSKCADTMTKLMTWLDDLYANDITAFQAF